MTHSPQDRSSGDAPLNLLVITPHDADVSQLKTALAGSRWNLLHASTCSEALETLEKSPVPVIIRDHECCNVGCPHAVKCHWIANYPASLLIAAESRNFHLWEEVLDAGGLDVLAKPFDPPTVRKFVDFAHKHWVMGQLHRDWDHFDFPE